MIVTTTPTLEGHNIREYLGVVTGEVIVGANIFKDLFAGIRDIVGGRAGAYEQTLRDARREPSASESRRRGSAPPRSCASPSTTRSSARAARC